MKVILLKEIPKLGHEYDIKNVSDGHAQNFLIPRGLVAVATDAAVKKLEEQKEKDGTEKKIQAELLREQLGSLKGVTIKISGKANDKGHLFAGIGKETLLAEIFKQTHLNLDPESLVLDKPLKELGEHKVAVAALGKSAELTVLVEMEK
jgi:large subunit ribosomal protein L9